ncbi:Oleate-induced peroxisomal protein POX18 [Smittium mucronatum]|uniref:Oleate-induced peroxisomal protein POX18 n=1 Tax=Smittium mucronatum TaxID=133383 RepID=A0A1R0GPQ8_9FUNG|nr:Oleate-induced peroxisomal protein POX18 [Smittium mucronatum]
MTDFICAKDFSLLAQLLPRLSKEEKDQLIASSRAAYLFAVEKSGKKHFWLLDLAKDGALTEGSDEKQLCSNVTPGAKIECSDKIMHELIKGKTDPTQAFMMGKLSVKGNLSLAMNLKGILSSLRTKLDSLPQTSPQAANPSSKQSPAKAAAAPVTLASATFNQLSEKISNVPADALKSLLGDINSIIQFDLSSKNVNDFSFILDLESSENKDPKSISLVGTGKSLDLSPSITIQLLDTDFVKLLNGKLNGQAAFIQGKLKLKGNIMLAMKLERIFRVLNSSIANQLKSKL